MASYPKNVWAQLKNITSQKLITALKKDRWTPEQTIGASQPYYKDGRRVTIHVHPKKTYTPKLLKAILDIIDWTEAEMRKLKLIK